MTKKETNIQKLLYIAKYSTPLNPPCCHNNILDLFSRFFHLWLPQSENNDELFLEYMNNNFANITTQDIAELREYLLNARHYLIDICCVFAGIYQKYGGPRKNYGQYQKYCDILISTCLKTYSWLNEDYLYENLWQICRLCNW